MCRTSQKINAQEPRALRRTLGQYPTGVAVVTAAGQHGQSVGMTINSFSSISLAPPLIGWCIDRSAGSYAAFVDSDGFTLSILARGQDAIARRFATRGTDKFRGLASELAVGDGQGQGQGPVIPGACAWLHCRVYCRVALGDHLLIVGLVLHHRHHERQPLVFAGGQFAHLASAAGASAA